MLKIIRGFSILNKKAANRCLVLHPVSYPKYHPTHRSKGPTIEHYLAEEAIGLASSLGWHIVAGPFWNS